MLLQTAQAVAQGIDVLGKMEPQMAGIAAQMQDMLREGLRGALQQGLSGPEPSQSQGGFSQMAGPPTS